VSSTGALSLEEVPDRMVVIGAGVIGLELVSQRREVVVREVGGRRKEEEGTREERRGQLGKKDWGKREGGTECGRGEGEKGCHFWDDLPTVGICLESSRVKGHCC